jgi:putative spermidine/putrescine transport system substrate-binding protein/spermidine/putrescine transport system substrate-binding protein
MGNEELARLITRRIALKRAAGGAAGFMGVSALLAACGGGDSSSSSGGSTQSAAATPAKLSGTLNCLCWEGYTDDSFVKPFTQETGVKVRSTFIGSNDELIAKLRGAPDQYDLISPSSDTTQVLIEAGQVQPIDLGQVPNAKTTFEFFRTAPNVNVDGKLYGIPMAWGFIPLIYDADKIKTAPDSWNALWDPQYRDKVSVWQDIALIWSTALLMGDEDPYNLDDAKLNAIKSKLVEQKPNIRKYWTTAGELTNLFANKEIVIGMSFGGLTANQLRQQGRNVEEVIPKEGATSWFDNWMIPKASKKTPEALAFLNHIHKPESQKAIAKSTGYGISNQNAVDLVPKDYAKAYHLDDPSFISDLSYWQRVPERQKYLDVLNAVVAA